MKRILISILFILLNTLLSFSFNYEFKSITLREGLSHADANYFIQDSQGFLWIATFSGLDRFDGTHVKSYFNTVNSPNKPFYNRISSIDLDKENNIWMATAKGVCFFNTREEKFTHFHSNLPRLNNGINQVYIQEQYLYLRDKSDILHICFIDKNKKELIPIYQKERITTKTLFKDKNKSIWLETSHGIRKYISYKNYIEYEFETTPPENISAIYIDETKQQASIGSGNKVLQYNIIGTQLTLSHSLNIPENSIITDIVKDSNGEFWIGSSNGLYKTSFQNNLSQISSRNNSVVLRSNHINKLLIDRVGTLFIATYAGGVSYTDLNPFLSSIYQSSDMKYNFIGTTIRSINEFKNNLYLGTHTNGIVVLNKNDFSLEYTINNSNLIKDNNIRSSLITKQGWLWLAHNKGLEVIDVKNKKNITKEVISSNIPDSPMGDIAIDIYQNIWAFGKKGFFWIGRTGDKYSLKKLNEYFPEINSFFDKSVIISSDPSRPEIYYPTKDRLYRLMIDNNGNILKKIVYKNEKDNSLSLKSDFVCSVYRENDSILWVGHIGDALSCIHLLPNDKYKAENFPLDESYRIRDFENILPDNYGNLWITGNGILTFDTKSKKYKIFASSENRYMNTYKLKSCLLSKNGKLYFGGNNGFTIVPPTRYMPNKYQALPTVTDLLINNKPLFQNNKRTNVVYTDHITLNHSEDNLTFYCSAMHYTYASNCQFRYKLHGADSHMKTLKNASFPINYSNLKPGKYIFELYASNNDGVFNTRAKSLSITILPPWWLSSPMKIIYVITFLFCLIMIYRYTLRLKEIKHQIEIQKIQQSNAEKMNNMQLQLFTNISHEFRGPLSLILGIEEQLRNNIKNTQALNSLSILHKNAFRLLNLINELMDFRKAKTHSFKLGVQPVDANLFVKSLADEFINIAEKNNILYNIKISSVPSQAYLDIQLLEKMVLNLLNNAFKYCKEGIISIEVIEDSKQPFSTLKNSIVIVSPYETEHYFTLRIKDTGIGISKESINHIFNRYYQIEDSDHDPHLGSGVGLALVKDLVLLHKGKLMVFSERNKGTEFVLSLPSNKEDYTPEEIRNKEIAPSVGAISTDHLENIKPIMRQEYFEIKQLSHLLLVEDSMDIREFWANSLSLYFHISTASNGKEAIERLKEQKPDVIVSDLMMPYVNGNQLCEWVKKDKNYSNIPFILLTGKDNLQTQEESLRCGADAFLYKPTSISILLNTINNQLNRTQHIKEYISSDFLSFTLKNRLTQDDKELGEKIIKIINEHIENTTLDASFISKTLGISRSGLYQKTKNIFDVTLIELVREIRLSKAIQLMCENDYSLSEIATKTGFTNQSYFSISFKKKYNVPPKQYLKILKGDIEKKNMQSNRKN